MSSYSEPDGPEQRTAYYDELAREDDYADSWEPCDEPDEERYLSSANERPGDELTRVCIDILMGP
jgi:hypothetical protein